MSVMMVDIKLLYFGHFLYSLGLGIDRYIIQINNLYFAPSELYKLIYLLLSVQKILV